MRVRSVYPGIFFLSYFDRDGRSRLCINSQILGGGEEQKLDTFKLIRVADLKALLAKQGSKIHLYDANIDVTREKFGIIPGATLLASDENYPLSVLPPSKHAALVFYCADQH